MKMKTQLPLETRPLVRHLQMMMVSSALCQCLPKFSRTYRWIDDEDDDDYIDSFFDGILGDDDGKTLSDMSYHPATSYSHLIDDDDDDEDEISQPAQVPQQITPAEPAEQVAVDEAVADNIDDLPGNNEISTDSADSGAKDPQQIAQDQAATINNNIDPVGNEAIVDDEDGKFRTELINFFFETNRRLYFPDDDDDDDLEDALDVEGKPIPIRIFCTSQSAFQHDTAKKF